MRYASALQRCFALGLLLLTACPGGTDLPGNDTPSVSNAERLASLDKIEKMIEPIELNGDPAVSDQIAALLSAMSEFATVNVFAGSVVARFTDDELLVVINNRPANVPASPSQRRITPAFPSARVIGGSSSLTASIIRTPGEGNVTALPTSKKALVINAMGTSYTDDTKTLRDWLASAGYEATRSNGTVESFRNDVKDIGVLYVSAHGQLIPALDVPKVLNAVITQVAETLPPTVKLELEQPEGWDHFILWTSTEINNQTVEQYRKEVRDGRLAYCIAQNNLGSDGSPTKGRHFGITEAFVVDNWRCQAGALMYMDCCFSASSGLELEQEETNLLWFLCLHSEVNASTYVGWSNRSFNNYTSTSVRYFFDRVLGMNSYAPAALPQRPFSVRQVASAMQQRKRSSLPAEDPPLEFSMDLPLDQSIAGTGGLADLRFIFRAPTQDCFLLPGILNLKAGSDTLTLQGTFGDEPGTVTVGGTPCGMLDWTTNQIRCGVPKNGPGSSGNVVVEAGERQSNPRALTQWDLTLRRVFMDYPTQGGTDCPSCFYDATLHYTFRADVGGTRLDVDGAVSPTNYTGGASDGSIDVTNAGGSYFIGQGSTITLAPNPNDGAAFIGTCVGFAPPADNNYLGACFFLKGDESVIAFSPTISAEGLFRNYTGGTFDGIVDPYQVVYSGNLIGNELVLTYSPNFTIMGGSQATGPNSYFEWDSADAQNPADPNDPK